MIITDGKITSLVNYPVAIAFLVLAVLSVWKFSSLQMTQATPQKKET